MICPRERTVRITTGRSLITALQIKTGTEENHLNIQLTTWKHHTLKMWNIQRKEGLHENTGFKIYILTL